MYALIYEDTDEYNLIDLDTLEQCVKRRDEVDESEILTWNSELYLMERENIIVRLLADNKLLVWFSDRLVVVKEVRSIYRLYIENKILVISILQAGTGETIRFMVAKEGVFKTSFVRFTYKDYGTCSKKQINRKLVLG